MEDSQLELDGEVLGEEGSEKKGAQSEGVHVRDGGDAPPEQAPSSMAWSSSAHSAETRCANADDQRPLEEQLVRMEAVYRRPAVTRPVNGRIKITDSLSSHATVPHTPHDEFETNVLRISSTGKVGGKREGEGDRGGKGGGDGEVRGDTTGGRVSSAEASRGPDAGNLSRVEQVHHDHQMEAFFANFGV